jgi:hypothetical protein
MIVGDRVKIIRRAGCAGAFSERCTIEEGCKGKTGVVSYISELDDFRVKLDGVEYFDSGWGCWYCKGDTVIDNRELI